MSADYYIEVPGYPRQPVTVESDEAAAARIRGYHFDIYRDRSNASLVLLEREDLFRAKVTAFWGDEAEAVLKGYYANYLFGSQNAHVQAMILGLGQIHYAAMRKAGR